ncbi:hypothetical protein [Robertkochia flava]|uniref:hypothetical protein n=1 Tax=Robertkochia flava TaxID=3447986 RepID=UPI001CCB3D7A|nr:hypothetical protein [Robertkochia marina]
MPHHSLKTSFIYFVSTLCIFLISCETRTTKKEDSGQEMKNTFNLPDSLSARRLTLVLALRDTLGANAWEGFNKKRVEGTFNYFNGTHSEIFFPDSLTLAKLDTFKKYSEDYVLSPRTDTIPYHFELMISFDPADSAKYYYEHPVQQFLSVEETRQFIPSVTSTEWWTTMVIHEMFHHYQYNTPAFGAYARSVIGNLPIDIRNLIELCQTDTTFLEMIRKENDLLLGALAENNDDQKIALLREYLSNREKRISKYGKDREFLEQVENYYVIQEGGARYLEYQAMKAMEDMYRNQPEPILENDTLFRGFEEFREVDLTREEFSYLTYADPYTYHYAIGFNLMRVLDALNIDYRQNLLHHPEVPLHQYLKTYLDSATQAGSQ